MSTVKGIRITLIAAAIISFGANLPRNAQIGLKLIF
jgi:hypothetical protein